MIFILILKCFKISFQIHLKDELFQLGNVYLFTCTKLAIFKSTVFGNHDLIHTCLQYILIMYSRKKIESIVVLQKPIQCSLITKGTQRNNIKSELQQKITTRNIKRTI